MLVCTRDDRKCFLWNVDAVEVIAILIPLIRVVRLPAPASRIVKCRHPFSNPIEYGKQYVEMVGSGGRGLRIASIRWWMKMCSWEVCFRMSIPSALVLCLVVGFQIVNVVVTSHKPVDIETHGSNGCRIC